MGVEMLRGVYTERRECAQQDSTVLLLRHRHLREFRLLSPLMAVPTSRHLSSLLQMVVGYFSG
jgi:hypothetical protein